MRRMFGAAVRLGAVAAIAGAVVAVVNSRYLANRELDALAALADSDPADQPTVSVLVPMRNETLNASECLAALRDVRGINEILVIDDDSDDNTAELIAAAAQQDSRIRVIANVNRKIPANWLGKNWACVRLAKEAESDVLAFIDADVRLQPHAIEYAVSVMQTMNLDLVSPYPRQLTPTVLSRLVQPLLQWSWMSLVPLAVADSTQHRTMAVGNGQFMVVRTDVYESVGGHAAVSDSVIEDIGLARLLRTCGHRTAVTNGAQVASCQMYATDDALIEGYTKSLAFGLGGTRSAYAAITALKVAYILPPLAALFGRGATRRWGLLGYAAAVAGRVVVAKATSQPAMPDSLCHPLSIGILAGLTRRSITHRRAGTLTWRGRALEALHQH